MSEYQYYEFQSIEQPLNNNQKSYIQSLSSRASVSSRKASFVYNYGDFSGDISQLMQQYFDAMLYISNWGSRHLRFRIPCELIGFVAFVCLKTV